jgi:aerotaxis receptor
LAFVVTDENGVIADMNDVFVAWTRFARERVLGSPHSIVRHPGMPAGLFKLVWDRLKTGQPACAYLQNLPADGNSHTVLVTMSPTVAGYLAVQQKPCRPEAAEAVQKLYQSVREAEFEALDEGVAPETVPTRGADLLVDLLRQLGFSSYDDFMWTALPQEVDEYHRRTPAQLSPLTDDDGSPAAAIMAASQDLAHELAPWSQQQAELLRTWGTLSRTLVSLSPMMDEAKRSANQISQQIEAEPEFKSMSLSITVWASMIAEIEKVITDLPADLLGLRQACAQTRFWIGLAQIHTQMVRQYALDFADPQTMERSRGAVSRLCITLARDFDDLKWRMEKNASFAATVAERIQSLHDLLAMPANLIVNWKAMADGSSDEFVTRLLPEVDRQLSLASETLGLLQTLADQCQTIAVVQPMDVAQQCVQRIQRVLAVAPEQQVLRVEASFSHLPPYADLFRSEPAEVHRREADPPSPPVGRAQAGPVSPAGRGSVIAPPPGRPAPAYEPDAYPVPTAQRPAAPTVVPPAVTPPVPGGDGRDDQRMDVQSTLSMPRPSVYASLQNLDPPTRG